MVQKNAAVRRIFVRNLVYDNLDVFGEVEKILKEKALTVYRQRYQEIKEDCELIRKGELELNLLIEQIVMNTDEIASKLSEKLSEKNISKIDFNDALGLYSELNITKDNKSSLDHNIVKLYKGIGNIIFYAYSESCSKVLNCYQKKFKCFMTNCHDIKVESRCPRERAKKERLYS
jgi:hypothetical protein